MNEIPTELYGIPSAVIVMAVVAALERAGLPSRFAGLAAIGIGTVLGLVWELGNSVPFPKALLVGILWGVAVPVIHASIVNPLKQEPPVLAPPATDQKG